MMKDTLFEPGDKIPEPQMILESMRTVLQEHAIVLQQHEEILLYRFKTLDLEYHRRRDEIYQKYKASVAEDELKEFLSPDERLARVKRYGRETDEATAKLKEEFNLT